MDQELYYRLTAYLRENGILAASFSCAHRGECRRDVETYHGRFSEATDTEVGHLYRDGKLRIVHVSIDPGASEPGEDRTLPKEGTAHFSMPYRDRPNGHWYWLLKTVRPMMRAAGMNVKDMEAHSYLAHTRAARCTANLEHNQQAPRSLSLRCARYLPGELLILAPHLVLSMGNAAHEAIERTHEWQSVDGNDLRKFALHQNL